VARGLMKKLSSNGALSLIADDQADVREALLLLFKSEGYFSEAVDSPARLLESLRKDEFALVLMDLNYSRDTTSGQEGLELLSRIQELDSNVPVVVMTAWTNVELIWAMPCLDENVTNTGCSLDFFMNLVHCPKRRFGAS
jgi:FixJ family two-component response regulator